MSWADENGFTLLHHAVLVGMKGKVWAILQIVKETGVDDERIKKWVDAPSSAEEFTALHLASFKGNMDAIRALIAYGANIHAVNKFGLNMLHVAAQGDVACSLYFFKEKGVSLD